MKIDRIHHVAYRCKDAKETVLWYQKMLGMDFVLAIAEDHVPSTKEPDPYMHIFLDAGGGAADAEEMLAFCVEDIHGDLIGAEPGAFRQGEIAGKEAIVGQAGFLGGNLPAL